jgi:GDPmannose 4,6-dehydratase
MSRRALITGLTGQDGSYMAELLLEKGYEVYGFVRRTSHDALGRVAHLNGRVHLIEGDLSDSASIDNAVRVSQPDEVYNLGAQSFVATSWGQPLLTADVTGVAVVRLLNAIRSIAPKARFYQASSSEMFGNAEESPQSETTRFAPRSPYGAAKLFGHSITINYRESFGMYACSGICFNHESPRRGLEFVTRKITHGVGRIARDEATELRLGNLGAERDWGFAGDYVEAMWLMLQQDEPRDYVIATGESHSVREFVEVAFKVVGLDWEKYVVVDEKFMRPAEVNALLGDASLAREELGWKPRVSFERLVKMMVMEDS